MNQKLYDQIVAFHNSLNELRIPKLSNDTKYTLRDVQNLATRIMCHDKANPFDRMLLTDVLALVLRRALENGNDEAEQFLWNSHKKDDKHRIYEYMNNNKIKYHVLKLNINDENTFTGYWSLNEDDNVAKYGLLINDILLL